MKQHEEKTKQIESISESWRDETWDEYQNAISLPEGAFNELKKTIEQYKAVKKDYEEKYPSKEVRIALSDDDKSTRRQEKKAIYQTERNIKNSISDLFGEDSGIPYPSITNHVFYVVGLSDDFESYKRYNDEYFKHARKPENSVEELEEGSSDEDGTTYEVDVDNEKALDKVQSELKPGDSIKMVESKKVKFTKKKINEMVSSILIDRIDTGNHSLKNNPALPNISDENFVSDLVVNSYEDVVGKLKTEHGVDDIDLASLLGDYGDNLKSIKELEEGRVDEIITLVMDIIIEEFKLSKGDIEFDLDIVEDVTEFNNATFDGDIKFKNSEEIDTVNQEIHKRRVINALIQGGGRRVADLIEKNKSKISGIDPKLYNKYMAVTLFSDLMYYVNNDPNLNSSKSGTLRIITLEDRPRIVARAVNLPALLMEVGKGIFEVLTHDGLPKDERIYGYVINKADKEDFETDDIRLGLSLYDKIMNGVVDGDTRVKYLLVNKLSKVEVPEFHVVIRDILADTKDGNKYLDQLISGIKEELLDYDSNKKAHDESFFDSDELDDYDFGF